LQSWSRKDLGIFPGLVRVMDLFLVAAADNNAGADIRR